MILVGNTTYIRLDGLISFIGSCYCCWLTGVYIMLGIDRLIVVHVERCRMFLIAFMTYTLL